MVILDSVENKLIKTLQESLTKRRAIRDSVINVGAAVVGTIPFVLLDWLNPAVAASTTLAGLTVYDILKARQKSKELARLSSKRSSITSR